MSDRRETDGVDGGETGLTPRAGRRRRVIQQGRIVLGPDRSVACEVMDLSAAGARLRVPARIDLPEAFPLAVAADDLRTVAVRLRWRRGEFAGVTFEGAGLYVG
ncbi:pilus assembly protein PilZ [Methylobacterium tarhaniae]|uniref:Pilus assembly protein PilZ n=1 Tax=Methylobacterium tarhaniae TaxID=1187852 RepID=A0A0J6VSK9_9HYPH|nr:PilZ domain-containing protein [Methylobacterium tarhaniae]KMO42246.1 pilus assembly protein PilZ [Methylobacterium tarhaniae]